MPEELFVVRRLSKRYGSKEVLREVDFEVHRGECLVILGRSGSGKSVCLRQLNGLERPDAGSILFDGIELTALEEKQLYPVRRRIAMLFQSGALFDSMTIFENVAFPLRQHSGLDEDAIAAKVAEKLALVRLSGVEDRLPSALSGGMKKRAALARSLAVEPEVLLFDEPTTGLDPMTSATIGHLMRRARQETGVTSVAVTHDIPLARLVGDRVAFLDGGRFRFVGTWDEADRGADPLLQRFLAGEEEIEDVA